MNQNPRAKKGFGKEAKALREELAINNSELTCLIIRGETGDQSQESRRESVTNKITEINARLLVITINDGSVITDCPD